MSHADPFEPDGPVRRGVAWGQVIPLITLVILSGILLVQFLRPEVAPAPEPAKGIGEQTPLPPPDDSIVFEAVRDEAPLQFSETAAYAELLDRARRTPIETLRETARTDVVFSDLLDRPERYRGLPIRLQGTARRILRIDDLPDRIAPEGALYEAWTFTGDSRGFPYVLVFEDAPQGLPGGDDVNAFVIFHGYFFKLLAYNAADKARKAPMLIGRLEYVPDDRRPAEEAIAPGPSSPAWLLGLIGLVIVYLVVRSVTTARALRARAASARQFQAPPRDHISPEELDEWLQGNPDEAEDQPPSNQGS
ncbi:hypothetical protein [Tautonia marina]|uniref:hypothetical protein n=1 Tax=Tautonia marina TaxID=2653855 RepID=UPI0012608265|nr:hypothetical protein [Tautonia marina]